MTSWFVATIIIVSTTLSWRLIGVIVDRETDDKHRETARRTLTTIWGASILGSSATTATVHLHQLGIL